MNLRATFSSHSSWATPPFKTLSQGLFKKPLPNCATKSQEPMLALAFLYETSKLPDGHKEQSREMLNRMILAMNISQDSYKVFEFAKEDIETAGYKEGLIGDISSARPKIVVTFGAMATNLLLNKRERLGRIHGLFFNQALPAHHTTKVIPVFHPDFLCINPKMKRAAWNDLQKVMKVLDRS